ncbi:MAG: molybdopterin-synthase adenylyltransferase MoeB [Acidobacteria bacterium]|nr:MAG: molybdopterin-synthase adenylyltransferase MoeB [Acidobacteriota bacterium]REK00173.1 MAG: molybdopterin-synthase adenylyltransferase MoeB [Acidobacteriota bacterium]
MSVQIQIPTPLRRFADDQAQVPVQASTVGDALEALVAAHPQLRQHLYDGDGRLRSFVNVFRNDEDVRYLERDATSLSPGDTLTIIPSIAGGAGAAPTDRAPSTLPELSPDEIRRYSRHLILPEVGVEGQRRLKAARVLLVGAGGLGSPTGMYLAAAGVGTLGLVEFDRVDESNLQRQLLYGQNDIGRPKIEAASERLRLINPHLEIEAHETALSSENALDIVGRYDLVVDGTDNFPTRYLVNDACVLTGRPNVYGSIFRFEGQVSIFHGAEGPCYRCLFAEPPPPGLVPSCAEGGVLGVLPGIIGCLQANETIKWIVGAGQSMLGRLLLFDALKLDFRELKLRKNPQCPICGPEPTLTELIDYHQFCGVPAPGSEPNDSDLDVGVVEASSWLRSGEARLLDVRTAEERDIAIIGGDGVPPALHVPIAELEARLGELDPGDRWVIHCHHGPRSTRATKLLRERGFDHAYNLAGGIDAWSLEVDPSVPRY